jgi:hypothetical protein
MFQTTNQDGFFQSKSCKFSPGVAGMVANCFFPPSLIHSRATGAAKPFWKLM